MKKPLTIILLAILLAALTILVTACSQQEVRPYGQSHPGTDPAGVEIRHSFPDEPHERIGAVEISHYRPGFREPTVTDAGDRIRAAGAELGADAVVVTHSQSTGERSIQVTGEAIRWAN